MKKLLLSISLFVCTITTAQVGINTTNPQSSLDITASNSTSPSSTDGILIPRINNFPATNPIVDQQSMLVYLTTDLTNINISGTPQDYAAGFYYWDNVQTNWIGFNTGEDTSGWRLDGNVVTSSDFLGSTNTESVFFRADNRQIGRLYPNGSVVFGFGAEATNDQAIALGENARASQNSVSLGSGSQATSTSGVSIGNNAQSEREGIAIGFGSKNNGVISVSVGKNAQSQENSIAVGHNSRANSLNSVAIGLDAESALDNSIAIGTLSEANGTSGIAIGDRALSSTSGVALGQNANSSSEAIAIGHDAENTGVQSIAIGTNSKSFVNGISIGNASTTNFTGSGATAIGNNTLGGGSNSISIGESASTTSASAIAIGSTSSASGSNGTAIGSGTSVMHSNATAIGSGAATTATNQVVLGNTFVTQIGGYAPFTDISDARFKYDIKENVPGLDFISKLQTVTYKLDREKIARFNNQEVTGTNTEKIHTGFLAQQVDQIATELGYDFNGVNRPKDLNTDHYTVSYSTFVVPLVKAVQEQQEIIDTQNKKIDVLEARLKKLESFIEGLK